MERMVCLFFLSQCSSINVKEQTNEDLQEIQANLKTTTSVGVY